MLDMSNYVTIYMSSDYVKEINIGYTVFLKNVTYKHIKM